MAGKIPQQFIDELLQRVDIVDVIDQRVPLRKAGKDYQARCPFHDEKSPSFTVSQVKQFYHCFGCGANGNVISFLMEYDHMGFPEAIEELAGRVGMKLPERATPGATDRSHDVLLPLLEQANRYFRTQLRRHADAPAAVDYLKGRGLSGAVAKRFEIGFAPESWDALIRAFDADAARCAELERAGLVIRNDKGRYYDRFRGRVMFPIRDHRGRVVGFGGRVLGAGEPKYLNSPETPVFHKGSELYNVFGARGAIRDSGHAVVVEGYMDVVALAEHGIDNAVATLGTATTAAHLHRLFRLASHVVFCFDGDRAGVDAARKAMEVTLPEMHGGRQVSFLFLPEGMDPDDFVRRHGADAFRDAVAQATPLDVFLFDHLKSQTDLARQDGRARLVELARPLIGAIPPGPYKVLLGQRLAELSGVGDDAVAAPPRRPPPRRGGTPTPPSAFASLLSLLLQYPHMARQLPPLTGLDEHPAPAARVLAEVLAMLADGETPTTAALVERFRDSEHHRQLEKLAGWNHPVADDRLPETVRQTADAVRRTLVEHAIDTLLEKSAREALSEDEKAELNRFVRLQQALRMDASSAER